MRHWQSRSRFHFESNKCGDRSIVKISSIKLLFSISIINLKISMNNLQLFRNVCVVLSVLLISVNAGRSRSTRRQDPTRQAIANPLLEAFTPRGLRVSIADMPGIDLYAFHGKINAPIEHLEAGSMSKDIIRPKNGRWIFEDKTVRLHVGDVVNYWIYVQIDGIGHRVDNLSTVIRELLPATDDVPYQPSCELNSIAPANNPTYSTEPSTTQAPTTAKDICDCNREQLNFISLQLNITLMQLSALNDKMEPLKKQVDNLKEFIEEISKEMDIGTKLLLVGQQPPHGNLLEAVRNVITDKLELFDLEGSLKTAQKTPRGILFEVSSSVDKKRILLSASKRLQSANYKITDPEDREAEKNGTYLLDERSGE